MKTGLFRAVAASAIASASAYGAANAQAVPPAPAAEAPATQTVAEVIVTAEKRAEKLNTVPISITAISAKLLNDTASKNLEELQGIVPGVTIPAATAYGGSSIVGRRDQAPSSKTIRSPSTSTASTRRPTAALACPT